MVMLPCPVARRYWSAQSAPAAKKITAKVPKNSASNFWVRLYTALLRDYATQSGWVREFEPRAILLN